MNFFTNAVKVWKSNSSVIRKRILQGIFQFSSYLCRDPGCLLRGKLSIDFSNCNSIAPINPKKWWLSRLNFSIITCICILVFKTSRGKQAVTDITEARLLLRKRTLDDISFGLWPAACCNVEVYYSLLFEPAIELWFIAACLFEELV